MNQNKYVDIFLGQQETLYRESPFSRLKEVRTNYVVRRYHALTGKQCADQDEFVEHGNRFFSEFPMPKTLSGFANQSVYVGVGLMCKQFTSTWYITNYFNQAKTADYKRTAVPSMSPEKKLVYEVFSLLHTHVCD